MQDSAIFELDDEDTKLLPTIDSSHQFLNFSRRVAEAASMRKPVDIQLGIACGRDLAFPSLFKTPPAIKIQSPFPEANASTEDDAAPSPTSSDANASIDEDIALSPSSSESNVSTDYDTAPSFTLSEANESIEDDAASSPTLSEATVVKEDLFSGNEYGPQEQYYECKAKEEPPAFNFSANDTLSLYSFTESDLSEDATSISLDKLVADVFNYMDSCPNHSAYSEDLRSLKSKLQDYNTSRTSFDSIDS